MLDLLSARAAALRHELVQLDQLSEGGDHVALAACHLQNAIDILDEAHALQSASAVAGDDRV